MSKSQKDAAKTRKRASIRRNFKLIQVQDQASAPTRIPLRRKTEIIAHAMKALDGAENAKRWLNQPNHSLEGRTPMAVLAEGNPDYAERIDELLYGLEYGMYA